MKDEKNNPGQGDDVVFDENIDEDGNKDPAALVKKLRQRIKELEGKSQEYLAGWQKERADGVNLRKRLEEEKKEFAKFAKEDVATEIIPFLIHLSRHSKIRKLGRGWIKIGGRAWNISIPSL
jgi:molecular chaperone GrpE (heat shock protein)